MCANRSNNTQVDASQVLEMAKSIARELHPARPISETIDLDASLERDFGLDSLARMELVGRIDQTFDVTLNEQAIANAQTPGDLLVAARAASGRATTPPPKSTTPKSTPKNAAEDPPQDAATLTQALDWHAARHPDHPHIRLYDDETDGEVITYTQLRSEAMTWANTLATQGFGAGDAAAIMLPTGRAYFVAFFAILYAGGIPVPIYPPARLNQLSDHIQRHVKILDNCQTKVLITIDEAAQVAALLKGSLTQATEVLTPDDLGQARGEHPHPVIKADDVAFLQYTSGSTGTPKGVTLTHANLMANIQAMGDAVGADPNDVFISWLPLYHDMGLIGAWLGSLVHGVPLVIMSPLAFLARPRRWLDAITRYKGTLSAAPNFAYELCLKRIADEELKDFDLSTLRATVNGAEPVVADTLSRFDQRFAACGFNEKAMKPSYGLAECSVGLALAPMDRGPRIDRIIRDRFTATGEAIPAPDNDDKALNIVSCGRALPGHDIRIVDEDDRELAERQEGRLQFRGPSTTSGYWRNAEQTRELIRAGWLESGDRAYMADDEVFITGRAKDIIIRAGRNIHPAELEDAVGELDGVLKGGVCVFGSADPKTGTERLIVMAETRKQDDAARQALTRAIEGLTQDLTATPPDEVVLAPPNTVLKTSSGKTRRAASREIYERGEVGADRPPMWRQMVGLTLSTIGPTLKRSLRTIARSLFTIWAGLVALLSAGPILLCVAVLPNPKLRWAAVRIIASLVFMLTAIRVRTVGRDHLLLPDAPLVFVANHQSYLDTLYLALALKRPLTFVAKGELQNTWPLGFVLKRLGTAFVERFDARKSAEDAAALSAQVRTGRQLFYFPEGTFVERPGLLAFRMGAFTAAVEAGASVQPIVLSGARHVLRGDGFAPRPGRVTVTIGEAIPAPREDDGDAWTRAIELRDRVRGWVLETTPEPDMAHDRPAIFERDEDG